MYLLGHTAAIPDMVVIQQAAQNATPLLEINIICGCYGRHYCTQNKWIWIKQNQMRQ